MTDRISPKRFHEVGWRVVRDDASLHFRTGSFAAGVALVDAIGRMLDTDARSPGRRPPAGRRDGAAGGDPGGSVQRA